MGLVLASVGHLSQWQMECHTYVKMLQKPRQYTNEGWMLLEDNCPWVSCIFVCLANRGTDFLCSNFKYVSAKGLCPFPLSMVTKYQYLGGLKTTEVIVSQF